MSIYGDYAQSVQKSGIRAVTSDADFSATIGEVTRSTAAYQKLTGIVGAEEMYFNPMMSEGLDRIGFEKVSPRQGREFGLQERQYDIPTRDLYKKHEAEIIAAGGMSLQQMDEKYGAEVKQTEKDMGVAYSRASTMRKLGGALAGGVKAGVYDPTFWATMPIGLGYKGGSIAAFAVRDAIIQGTIAAGTEKLIIESNREMLDRAGVTLENEDANIAIAALAAFGLQLPAAVGGSMLKRAEINRLVNDWAKSKPEDMDEAAFQLIAKLEKEGYKLDSRQKGIIEQAKSDKKRAGELKAYTPDQRRNLSEVGENQEARAKGEPFDKERIDNNAPVERALDDLTSELETIKKEVRARQSLEASQGRATKSKPLKKMERQLDKIESEFEKVRAKQNNVAKSIESVENAVDNLSISQGRLARAQKEYSAARQRAQELRDKVLSKRNPKAREVKRVREAEGVVSKARERVEVERARQQKARKKLEQSEKQAKKAADDLNEAMADPKQLEEINKQMMGFKFKKPKVEKGQTVRPRADSVHATQAGKPARGGEKPRPNDNGMPDEVAVRQADQKHAENKERIQAEAGSEIDQMLKEIEADERMGKGIEQALACSRGGQ